MIRTLFILDELYPVDRGGIGRLMFNIVQHAKQTNPALDMHILLGREKPADHEKLVKALNGAAQLHFLQPAAETSKWLGIADIAKSGAANPILSLPVQSGLRILGSALAVQDHVGMFDHIEVPDHMGIGAVLLMARAAGLAFEESEVTCRLHSSLSAIISHEPFYHARSEWIAPRIEFERLSLRLADRVVAHIPALAEYNQRHFGFKPEWLDKVEVAFPPAIWPPDARAPHPLTNEPDFVFTSRFQPFKRPDLFIKAACRFLDDWPEYSGRFRLVSYGYNAEYIDSLRLMIPERHQSRIVLAVNLSNEDRDAAMAGSIIVQPSNFESLCALAYEVAVDQNPILLAGDCAAFGDFERWVDGENCLLFAPNPVALAKTMRKAVSWRPSRGVDIIPDPTYFAQPKQVVSPPSKTSAPLVLVGPLRSDDDFAAFAGFAAQPGITATGFASSAYKRDGFDNVAWLSEAGYLGAQLRALGAKSELVVLASPQALPDAKFLETGTRLVREGVAFSANSMSGDPAQLNIYSGKMLTLLASDYRLCPPCIMLHNSELNLISPIDDQELILRFMARLAASPVELILSPLPLIRESTPLAAQKPDRRLIGFERIRGWQNGMRNIAVDVKSARHTPLLHEEDIKAPRQGALGEINLAAAAPVAMEIDFGRRFHGEIIGLKIVNTSDIPAAVSLHRGGIDAAIKAHNRGMQQRKFAGKQGYIARWGTNWGAGRRVLVASADKASTLSLERIVIYSRK